MSVRTLCSYCAWKSRTISHFLSSSDTASAGGASCDWEQRGKQIFSVLLAGLETSRTMWHQTFLSSCEEESLKQKLPFMFLGGFGGSSTSRASGQTQNSAKQLNVQVTLIKKWIYLLVKINFWCQKFNARKSLWCLYQHRVSHTVLKVKLNSLHIQSHEN